MFCPNCGSKVPDDARFCGNCGKEVGAPASVNTNVSASVGSTASDVAGTSNVARNTTVASVAGSAKLSSNAVGALIAGVIALICSFLPWFNSSSQLLDLGRAGSAVGSVYNALGGSSSIHTFSSGYGPWQFPFLIGDLSSYSHSYTEEAMVFLVPVFILWLVGAILGIVGFVGLIRGNFARLGFAKTGMILLAICAVAWIFLHFFFASAYMTSGFPIFALLCAIASIASIVYCSKTKHDANKGA